MTYLGNPPVNGVFKKLDNISGSFNGSTTTFNLTSGGAATTPGLAQNLIISLGGVIQEPGSAFTINGSTVSFTSAPATNTTFWGIQLGDVGLATNPNQSAMTTQVFTATAGQTTFTVAGGYTAGQIQIFENGVQLVVGADVTASNGTTFVLTNAATVGDTLVAIVYSSFIVANAVAKSGDTMTGALTVPNLAYTGTLTGSTGVLNIGSGQLYKDSSGNVGIGTSSPGYKLDVSTASASDGLGINLTNSGSTGAGINFLQSGVDSFFMSMPAGAGGLRFVASGSNERMRIDSSGNLLMGTTSGSTTSGIGVKVNTNPTAPYVATVGSDTTSSNGAYYLYSTGAAAYRFYVGYNGTVFATSTTISGISDQRLKENVRDLDVGIDAIMALKPRKFDWKAGKGKDIKDDRGFIAQEFEQVFPDLVDAWKDPAPEGEEPYKSVRADLIPILVKAIQELKAQNDELKARITALEGAAP